MAEPEQKSHLAFWAYSAAFLGVFGHATSEFFRIHFLKKRDGKPPHGFCDFAIGSAKNERMEFMLRKKMDQTGLERENLKSILAVNHFPKFCG